MFLLVGAVRENTDNCLACLPLVYILTLMGSRVAWKQPFDSRQADGQRSAGMRPFPFNYDEFNFCRLRAISQLKKNRIVGVQHVFEKLPETSTLCGEVGSSSRSCDVRRRPEN